MSSGFLLPTKNAQHIFGVDRAGEVADASVRFSDVSFKRPKTSSELLNESRCRIGVLHVSLQSAFDRNVGELSSKPNRIYQRRKVVSKFMEAGSQLCDFFWDSERMASVVIVKQEIQIGLVHRVGELDSTAPVCQSLPKLKRNPTCLGTLFTFALNSLAPSEPQRSYYSADRANRRPSIPVDHASLAQPPTMADAIKHRHTKSPFCTEAILP